MKQPETTLNRKAYGADWGARAVRACGITFAPEDLVLDEDVTLKDGTILKKGKKYFSWYEATALAAEGQLPKGWRLPTAKELRKLRDKVSLERIKKILRFGLNGYVISRKMDEYNDDPEHFENIHGQEVDGYYWSGTECCADYAYEFEFYKDGYTDVDSDYKHHGFSIRCVALHRIM